MSTHLMASTWSKLHKKSLLLFLFVSFNFISFLTSKALLKLLCFLSICDKFIGPYLLQSSGNFVWIFERASYKWLKHLSMKRMVLKPNTSTDLDNGVNNLFTSDVSELNDNFFPTNGQGHNRNIFQRGQINFS